jgi:hypothetical protein
MKSRIRQQHPSRGETKRCKRRVWSGVSFWGVVGLVGTMGFVFPKASCAAENGPSRTITVQIYNYSQASPTILTAAKHEAGRILGKAGLRVVWLGCPVGPSALSQEGPCQKALEDTDIRLRVLAEPVEKKFQNSVFGLTIHPVLASVYYEYATRLAKIDNAEFEIPIVLGCVIAHEIGHLLLGSNQHSGSGIMQPRWQPSHIRQLMMGGLLFTSEQSTLMREAARTRMDLHARNFKEQSIVAPEQQTGSESRQAK